VGKRRLGAITTLLKDGEYKRRKNSLKVTAEATTDGKEKLADRSI